MYTDAPVPHSPLPLSQIIPPAITHISPAFTFSAPGDATTFKPHKPFPGQMPWRKNPYALFVTGTSITCQRRVRHLDVVGHHSEFGSCQLSFQEFGQITTSTSTVAIITPSECGISTDPSHPEVLHQENTTHPHATLSSSTPLCLPLRKSEPRLLEDAAAVDLEPKSRDPEGESLPQPDEGPGQVRGRNAQGKAGPVHSTCVPPRGSWNTPPWRVNLPPHH